MATGNYVLPQYINPQHTDKMYNDHQLEQCFSTPRASNGLPFSSTPTSTNTRGLTLELSDTSTYVSEPSSASSMGSSPGYLTPCSSSNASSRRHSLILPESQQYFLSAPQTSPTPGPRRIRTRHHGDHSPLAGSFSSYSESLCSAGSTSFGSDSFHSAVPETDILMGVEMYQSKPNLDWQYSNNIHNHHHHQHQQTYDQTLQLNVPLSIDLAANFDASMSSQISDLPRQTVETPSLSSFHTGPSRRRLLIPTQSTPFHTPTLAEPFEPSPRSTRSPSSTPSSTFKLKPRSNRRPHPSSHRRTHNNNNTNQPPNRTTKTPRSKWSAPIIEHTTNNKHPCNQCPLAFKRPEHLKRHERKHLPAEQTNMLPCFFADCPRKIKDRPDNMRAHLQVTHFKYGKTERGGKNRRFSMKDSMEMRLKSEDARWTLLLEGAIAFGDLENGYWKMLGYSIKETQELRVKDLVPEWEGPEETRLKEFDPRWRQLVGPGMTFEQAMERGRWMPEGESEGLLGVDMLTTREMGLEGLDPRWRKLGEGGMSGEVAEKLGVGHLVKGGGGEGTKAKL